MCAFAVALGFAVGGALLNAERKLQRVVDAPRRVVAVPSDIIAIERGRYLFATRGCASCHGQNGAGKTFIDQPGGGLSVHAPNITRGPGSAVLGYCVEDWVRTVRHGVKPSGRPLFIMPSDDYARLTDQDMGALIAYLDQLSPAPGEKFRADLPLFVRAAYGFGVLKDAAEKIDHSLPPATPVAQGVNAAHGAYVAQMCVGCHGAGLSGGKIPGTPPGWPAAVNLTTGSDSALPRYPNVQAFVAMMRTGRRPDGSTGIREMPFEAFKQMSDIDLEALYVYLQTLPPRAYGNR